MRRRLRTLLALGLLCAATSVSGAPLNLTVASWNLEHLADTNEEGCRPRKDTDYDLLKRYAEKLGADVVAVQEVENAAALARVFDPAVWSLEISTRPDQNPSGTCSGMPGHNLITQRTGFAIRKPLRYVRNPDLKELDVGADNRLRYGVDITVDAGRPLRLLSVHLKSGCSHDPASSPREDCKLLFRQLPILKDWIAARAVDAIPFMILGDFNRQLQDQEEFWTGLNTPGDPKRELALPIALSAVSPCQKQFPKFIDHLVFGRDAFKLLQTGSFNVLVYDGEEKDFPSDHCPVSVKLAVPDLTDLRPSADHMAGGLKWFRRSVEYRLLSSYLYEQAARRVDAIKGEMAGADDWIVSMDADETIFDNSMGQLENESLGLGFVSERWTRWVERSAAEGVPGAIAFLNHVIASGGKVAIITNRDMSQDRFSWSNLVRLGLRGDSRRVCVVGRSDPDKQSANPAEWQQYGYVNDKDRRRRLFREGAVSSCWGGDPTGQSQASWNKPHRIVLSIGDNIQDMPGLKQDTARANGTGALVFGRDYFVIPNPLYGSWEANKP
jgi:predicted secreted acid phosphatase/endonuclease/exonuclease/phosphatase family metal-dependent hydrolase